MNFDVIDSETKMQQLTFDNIEQITLVLHHDAVSMTNRVLGWIAGKEKILEQAGVNVAAFKAKNRRVDLRLISPPSKPDGPAMIIQIEEWWAEVLRKHVRQLILDETHGHYIKAVLSAIPKRHAIQRMAFHRLNEEVVSLAHLMQVEQLAFVNCKMELSDLKKLLELPRPRLRHLFLEGVHVELTDPKKLIEQSQEGIKAWMSVLLDYFQRCVSGVKSKDRDLVAQDNTTLFQVDLQCNIPSSIPLPSFLLPRHLLVRLNGILQETLEREDSSSEEDMEEDILPSGSKIKRQRQESSEGVSEEEDEALHDIVGTLEEPDKGEEEKDLDPDGSGSEDVDAEERSEEEKPPPKKKPKKTKKEEEKTEAHMLALQHYFPTTGPKLNTSDPLVKAMARAASKARGVTCGDCHIKLSFRDLSAHKRSCKKER